MGRKVILSLATLLIISITTFIFHYTQDFYKSFSQGLRYFNADKYRQALPFFVSALETDPDDLPTAKHLAITYKELDMNEEALKVLNMIYKAYPDNLKIIGELADSYYGLDYYQNAEVLYKKILTKEDDEEVQKKLAEVLAWQKKYVESINIVEVLLD